MFRNKCEHCGRTRSKSSYVKLGEKLRTDLLTFGVAGAVFGIAGEMCQLPAYFDNPDY